MRFFQHYYPTMSLATTHGGRQHLDLMDDDSAMIWSLLASPLKRKWPTCQQVAKRFRVACDCRGFSAESIKAELAEDGKKLVLTGLEKSGDVEQYTLNQFRRKFDVPDNADTSKMKSFMTAGGQFIVEMPLKMTEPQNNSDDESEQDWLVPFPKLVKNKETGVNEACMSIALPRELDPAKMRVTVKDHDVIVQAKDEGGDVTMSYMRRSTMPAQCDMQLLRCLLDSKRGNRLLVTAPLKKLEAREDDGIINGWKSIPIEKVSATTPPVENTVVAPSPKESITEAA